MFLDDLNDIFSVRRCRCIQIAERHPHKLVASSATVKYSRFETISPTKRTIQCIYCATRNPGTASITHRRSHKRGKLVRGLVDGITRLGRLVIVNNRIRCMSKFACGHFLHGEHGWNIAPTIPIHGTSSGTLVNNDTWQLAWNSASLWCASPRANFFFREPATKVELQISELFFPNQRACRRRQGRRCTY